MAVTDRLMEQARSNVTDAFEQYQRDDDHQMWVTCEQKDVLTALAKLKPAIDARHPVEAFTGVRVVSDEYGAHLWATNGAVAARVDLDYLDGGAQPFDALVGYTDLVQGLRVMGRGPVMLDAYLSGGHCGLRLDADHRMIVLPALPTEEFPVEGPFDPDRTLLTTSAGPLATILERAAVMCSDDPSRGALTAVCLDFEDPRPQAVACNMHELCSLPLTATNATQGTPGVLLPPAAVTAVATALQRAGDTPVALATTRPAKGYARTIRHVMLELGDGTEVWSIRTVDGQYPNWRVAVPAGKPAARIDLDSKETVESITASLEMMKRNSPADVTIERDNGVAKVLLRVYNDDGMEFEQFLVDAIIKKGRSKPLTVALNPKYLLHAVQALGTPRAQLTIYDAKTPVLLEGGANRCVIAPVKRPPTPDPGKI